MGLHIHLNVAVLQGQPQLIVELAGIHVWIHLYIIVHCLPKYGLKPSVCGAVIELDVALYRILSRFFYFCLLCMLDNS